MERRVRERLGESGRYRLYVPERRESENGEGDELERIANSPSEDDASNYSYGFPSINE